MLQLQIVHQVLEVLATDTDHLLRWVRWLEVWLLELVPHLHSLEDASFIHLADYNRLVEARGLLGLGETLFQKHLLVTLKVGAMDLSPFIFREVDGDRLQRVEWLLALVLRVLEGVSVCLLALSTLSCCAFCLLNIELTPENLSSHVDAADDGHDLGVKLAASLLLLFLLDSLLEHLLLVQVDLLDVGLLLQLVQVLSVYENGLHVQGLRQVVYVVDVLLNDVRLALFIF